MEEATEEVGSTVLRVTPVIGAVIILRVTALAATISLDATLVATEVIGAVIILRVMALADTALLDDTMLSMAAMVGPAITLPVTALVAIAILVA
jgi:hypothetical protein